MKTSILPLSLPLAALTIGLLVLPRPALATDYVWSGTGVTDSTDWLSAKNWKTSASSSVQAPASEAQLGLGERTSGVPGAGDTATIPAGATVAINKPLTLAALTVQGGSTLQGTGDITVTSNLTLCDAQLSGGGKIFIAPNGTAVLSSQKGGEAAGNVLNKIIDNRGTANWISGKLVLQKDFTNRGAFTVSGDAPMQFVGANKPVFDNQGTLTKSGSGQSTISLPFKNSGDVYLRGGILDVGPNYVQTDGSLNLDGGDLTSSGTLQIDGGTVGGTGKLDCDVVNGGTFKPGHSPGFVYISGNYTQTTNGSLGMEVGGIAPGTGYDQMQINGSAYLAGNLDIQKYNSYTPTAGLNFEFLICDDIHGNFTTFSGLYPGNSLYYKLIFTTERYMASVYTDNTPPTAAINSPANNGNYIGVSSVQGVANDVTYASGVKVVTIQVFRYANSSVASGYLLSDNTWSPTYTTVNQLAVNGTTNWNRSLPTLAPGQYNVKATVTDNVGRRATSVTHVFNISPSGSGSVSFSSPDSQYPWLTSVLFNRKTNLKKLF